MTDGDLDQAAREYAESEAAGIWPELDALREPEGAMSDSFLAKCALLTDFDLAKLKLALQRRFRGFPVRPWLIRIKELRSSATESVSSKPKSVWQHRLHCTDKGLPKALLANAIIALREAPEWLGVLAFDELTGRPSKRKTSPAGNPGSWRNIDDAIAADWLQHEGIEVSPSVVADAVAVVAAENTYHPVVRYLEDRHWDGQARVQGWLTTYLGVEKSEYTLQVGTKWLISAVARALNPGCKVDTCLVLEGPQGLKKSTALEVLAGDDWFTNQVATLAAKDASEDLRGKWIVEFADLAAMGKAETRDLKSFLSRRIDHYRESYGRRSDDYPRHCVFAATTNEATYLRDDTGARRFWCVRCTQIDIEGLRRDRDQIWGEALAMYREGAHWWIEDNGVAELAREEQNARNEGDSWDELVWTWVESQQVSWPSMDEERASFEEKRAIYPFYTSAEEILLKAIKKEPERWVHGDRIRVGSILTRHGMEHYQQRIGAKRWPRYRFKEQNT